MGINYSPKIVTDGLVLYLDAGNRKSYPGSGNTWYNLSGTTNHGTLTNGPTFDNSNGGSLVFDGNNDYITVAHNSILNFGTSDFSVEWMGEIKNTGNYQTIFMKGGGGDTNGWGLIKSATNNQIWFEIYGSIGSRQKLTTTNVNLIGDYKHIIVTVNSSTRLISKYLNGNLLNSANFSDWGSSNNISYGVDIGSYLDHGQWFNNNKNYFVKLYNKLLSAPEVLQNYNATKGRYGL